MKKYKIGFDVVDPLEVLQLFAGYKLKVTNFTELYRTHYIMFEGLEKDLERWYNDNYETGEDFQSYLKAHGKVIRS